MLCKIFCCHLVAKCLNFVIWFFKLILNWSTFLSLISNNISDFLIHRNKFQKHLRRVQDTRDDSVPILRGNLLCQIMFKIHASLKWCPATHATKLRTILNITRHSGNSLANAVCNLSPTVAAQWDMGLSALCLLNVKSSVLKMVQFDELVQDVAEP